MDRSPTPAEQRELALPKRMQEQQDVDHKDPLQRETTREFWKGACYRPQNPIDMDKLMLELNHVIERISIEVQGREIFMLMPDDASNLKDFAKKNLANPPGQKRKKSFIDGALSGHMAASKIARRFRKKQQGAAGIPLTTRLEILKLLAVPVDPTMTELATSALRLSESIKNQQGFYPGKPDSLRSGYYARRTHKHQLRQTVHRLEFEILTELQKHRDDCDRLRAAMTQAGQQMRAGNQHGELMTHRENAVAVFDSLVEENSARAPTQTLQQFRQLHWDLLLPQQALDGFPYPSVRKPTLEANLGPQFTSEFAGDENEPVIPRSNTLVEHWLKIRHTLARQPVGDPLSMYANLLEAMKLVVLYDNPNAVITFPEQEAAIRGIRESLDNAAAVGDLPDALASLLPDGKTRLNEKERQERKQRGFQATAFGAILREMRGQYERQVGSALECVQRLQKNRRTLVFQLEKERVLEREVAQAKLEKAESLMHTAGRASKYMHDDEFFDSKKHQDGKNNLVAWAESNKEFRSIVREYQVDQGQPKMGLGRVNNAESAKAMREALHHISEADMRKKKEVWRMRGMERDKYVSPQDNFRSKSSTQDMMGGNYTRFSNRGDSFGDPESPHFGPGAEKRRYKR